MKKHLKSIAKENSNYFHSIKKGTGAGAVVGAGGAGSGVGATGAAQGRRFSGFTLNGSCATTRLIMAGATSGTILNQGSRAGLASPDHAANLSWLLVVHIEADCTIVEGTQPTLRSEKHDFILIRRKKGLASFKKCLHLNLLEHRNHHSQIFCPGNPKKKSGEAQQQEAQQKPCF